MQSFPARACTRTIRGGTEEERREIWTRRTEHVDTFPHKPAWPERADQVAVDLALADVNHSRPDGVQIRLFQLPRHALYDHLKLNSAKLCALRSPGFHHRSHEHKRHSESKPNYQNVGQISVCCVLGGVARLAVVRRQHRQTFAQRAAFHQQEQLAGDGGVDEK